MVTENKNIIVYDGACNLCDYSVQFILQRDSKETFTFASAQSEAGKELQVQHGVDTIRDGTVILLKEGQVYVKSDAALEIARELDGLWKHLAVLRWVPKSIRDYFYSIVSKSRYRWFGKRRECLIPDKNTRKRFL